MEIKVCFQATTQAETRYLILAKTLSKFWK